MNISQQARSTSKQLPLLILGAVFSSIFLAAIMCQPAAKAASIPAINNETLKLGERMYREGILPSGKPMKAFVNGNIPVEGTNFTCVSCHLRSGLGSLEGDIAAPPTNGRILYEPRKPYMKGYAFVPSFHSYSRNFAVRPAYTDESLATVIAAGVDPAGRTVHNVMPRYELEDQDMAILIAYLKSLSDKLSPGVTDAEIKFATVIVEENNKTAVASMLAPIEFGIGRKNSLSTAASANIRVARKGYNKLGPELLLKKFSLAKWVLKGPSSGWRQQLDAYYEAEPVFALLGGISTGDWQPVHQFCEDKKIPTILPSVDYPTIADNAWYTLYFSHGVRQEGEAAAQYLQGMHELFADKEIVQIIRDSRRGQALASGFRDAWLAAENKAPVDIILKKDQLLSPEYLAEINHQENPAVLLIWDDSSSLASIESLADTEGHPGIIVASGTYWGNDLLTLPPKLRKLIYFTYPYRLPQEDSRFNTNIQRVLAGKPINSYDRRIVRQSYIVNEVIGKALIKMRGEYYRDFLLDTIGMMIDTYYPLYERVGFGPGQRFISKGCFIVQLGEGANPKLERRSEWVTR